jgi:type I restriction enzyme R subunit
VKQATNEFKKHLPDSAPVNLLVEKEIEGRVFLSTYPTMMGLINESNEDGRRFGPGHFDLIVVDEAHRSVYQKYGAIFDYFDALLVGLTATPKDEIDVNTYKLFDLERSVPTDAYSLDEAVKDLYLVPPRAVSVPLRFQREGIRYDELTEDEKSQWDALEWDEEEAPPREVDPNAVNKWLFNKDTVDKVLEHLMTRGVRVAGGDRIGKTIVFAKNQQHAEFIAQRFDVNYPLYKGEFARVVHCNLPYGEQIIDDFSVASKNPHIAISVDMLDTGIDVPEVVNLVFFKLVRSKTKFWQMVGRGTRLSKDLFGPGMDKEFFYIFDYCQNLEFFSQNPATTDGVLADSLGTRLFKTRVALVAALDRLTSTPPKNKAGKVADSGAGATYGTSLRAEVAESLRTEVLSMNADNFVVRPKRRLVEKYAKPEAWTNLGADEQSELLSEVASLPSELPAEDEESKRFDLIVLKLELALLGTEPSFERLRDQVKSVAGLLEEKSAIPMVRDRMALIQDVQTDGWWQDVTLSMLEEARKQLRGLVKLIDKKARKPIYTDFEDQMGSEIEVALPSVGPLEGFEKFRAKARAFLRAHEDHTAIRKLRTNQPLTPTDLSEIERMLTESGVGGADDVMKAKEESHGLGLFVRALIGLDREAAKTAFASFLSDKTFTANQIEFVNMIVDHLTERGVMDAGLLYESPFTDLTAHGPDGLFTAMQVTQLIAVLDAIRGTAAAA